MNDSNPNRFKDEPELKYCGDCLKRHDNTELEECKECSGDLIGVYYRKKEYDSIGEAMYGYKKDSEENGGDKE